MSKINTILKEEKVISELESKIIKNSRVLNIDENIEGKVIASEHGKVYVDIGEFGTGIIYGVEYINARDMIKRLNVNDIVTAKVILTNNSEGYVELSLKEAKQALMWQEAGEAIKNNKVFELIVREANKGGLIIDWHGTQGFLPASQLSSVYYPKVEDGNKDKIMSELQKLIGKRIAVSILVAEAKENKLIFTQKNIDSSVDVEGEAHKKENRTNKDLQNEARLAKYSIGDIVEGDVTGVIEFGIFIKLMDSTEGLIHKSEIDWGLVEDTKLYAKVGDKVSAKIIEIKDGKISLSLKAMKENPWISASNKYNKGDVVSGLVIKYNKHGALVSIEEGVAGLIHVSDFENEQDLRSSLSLGKIYKFEISVFEPKDQKMILKIKRD